MLAFEPLDSHNGGRGEDLELIQLSNTDIAKDIQSAILLKHLVELCHGEKGVVLLLLGLSCLNGHQCFAAKQELRRKIIRAYHNQI